MADLNQLVHDSLAGLINNGGTNVGNSQFGQQAQSAAESTFGRGLGISTITQDALAKAQVNSALAAQQAQLAALGQAAGVAQQELNRGQAGSQFQQSLALQKKGLGQQSDIARNQLLAQGLGLGVGGLANVAGRSFGPEITGGLRRLAGVGGPVSPGGGQETMLPGQMAPSADTGVGGNISAPTGAGLGGLGLSDLTGGGAGSGGGMPDLSFLNNPSTSFNLDALSGLSGLFSGGDATANLPDFSQLWSP